MVTSLLKLVPFSCTISSYTKGYYSKCDLLTKYAYIG